jgi:hypothetical protein
MTALQITTLDMLRSVVAAQVAGGHNHWQHLDSPTLELYGYGYVKAFSVDGASLRNHVLEVLLDPAGLTAVFGDHIANYDYRFIDRTLTKLTKEEIQHWGRRDEFVAQMVVCAWLSKPEGDPHAAIETAFLLLPTP